MEDDRVVVLDQSLPSLNNTMGDLLPSTSLQLVLVELCIRESKYRLMGSIVLRQFDQTGIGSE